MFDPWASTVGQCQGLERKFLASEGGGGEPFRLVPGHIDSDAGLYNVTSTAISVTSEV